MQALRSSRCCISAAAAFSAPSAAALAPSRVLPLSVRQQVRHFTRNNSKTILNQWYDSLPLTKRWKRAIRKGTMVWEKGQVKIPRLKVEGYDCKTNPYRGPLSALRSPRIEIQD
ncbi:unnamed protein product [Vitrella brassicaformis CCMP3155]|uniref:Uncharacterized protein n=2 Tax=Vitrella brassicaformis TaxID=1169539 RepID=A0A0G4GFS3_VITBC|nr:unnamed protein product [Vitrella brassicaformis CCMP3155]|mmetsp:Transcript_2906/g.6637  ORF Transcript_2906/g.6637 Transcript_2906/m.6637 type:complete len:114 (+) Transcript_2906:39-380(+)|eukprot:CEM28373.1 unnamed protein product [Vitrella brassicaformis CCMP3155]